MHQSYKIAHFKVIIHKLLDYFAFSLANLSLFVKSFFEDENLKIKKALSVQC